MPCVRWYPAHLRRNKSCQIPPCCVSPLTTEVQTSKLQLLAETLAVMTVEFVAIALVQCLNHPIYYSLDVVLLLKINQP